MPLLFLMRTGVYIFWRHFLPLIVCSSRRWLHETSGYTNCYTGNEWDTTMYASGYICEHIPLMLGRTQLPRRRDLRF